MTNTLRTIDNIFANGFAARCLGRTQMDGADLSRWQTFDAEGRYLTEIMIACDQDGGETVYWLSPSIRFSDDIEQLRRLSDACYTKAGAA